MNSISLDILYSWLLYLVSGIRQGQFLSYCYRYKHHIWYEGFLGLTFNLEEEPRHNIYMTAVKGIKTKWLPFSDILLYYLERYGMGQNEEIQVQKIHLCRLKIDAGLKIQDS